MSKLPTIKQIRAFIKRKNAECNSDFGLIFANDLYIVIWTARVVDTSIEVPCQTFPMESEKMKEFISALMDAEGYEWREEKTNA